MYGLSLEELVEQAFYSHSKTTRRNALKMLRLFFREVGKDPWTVTRFDVDGFLVRRYGDEKRNAAKMMLYYLSKLFDYIDRRDLAEFCRERSRRIKLPEPKLRYLTREEAARLDSYLRRHDPENFALFGLMYMLGLRLNEVLSLRPEDFDFDRRLLRVRGKGSKVRIMALPNDGEFIAALRGAVEEARREGRSRVFDITPRAVEHRLRRLCQRAGVKPVNPHALRHTAALIAYEKTKDLRAVQTFLGHSKVTTTQIYAKVSGEEEVRIRREIAAEIAGALADEAEG